jgi:hypothetical protein
VTLNKRGPGALGGAAETGIDCHREHLDTSSGHRKQSGDRPPPNRVKLLGFRPFAKGALRGFARVELPSGLRISDIPVLISNGKGWASLPSTPVLDADGKHKVDINNKRQHVPVLEWRDRDLAARFSDAV